VNPAPWSILAKSMLHNFEFPAAQKRAYMYFCWFFSSECWRGLCWNPSEWFSYSM